MSQTSLTTSSPPPTHQSTPKLPLPTPTCPPSPLLAVLATLHHLNLSDSPVLLATVQSHPELQAVAVVNSSSSNNSSNSLVPSSKHRHSCGPCTSKQLPSTTISMERLLQQVNWRASKRIEVTRQQPSPCLVLLACFPQPPRLEEVRTPDTWTPPRPRYRMVYLCGVCANTLLN